MRFDTAGRNFAVADAVNGQTIVVDTTAEPPTAAFFADIPIAVADERVVTSQVVGQQADLSLLDPERKVLAKVSGELPVGGVLIDEQVVVVSSEGTISRFGEGDTEAERLGDVAVPPGASIRSVALTAEGTRFVVVRRRLRGGGRPRRTHRVHHHLHHADRAACDRPGVDLPPPRRRRHLHLDHRARVGRGRASTSPASP